jgi:ribonuclease Z
MESVHGPAFLAASSIGTQSLIRSAFVGVINRMSTRELIALGTGSQVPTRTRNHNAYFLRWDQEGFLFDPGEGTQRQMTFAEVSPSSIHHICITHFHGDHCLGLPGVLQRLSQDQVSHLVHVYYPESGQAFFERLCEASIYQKQVELVLHPIPLTRSGFQELTRNEQRTLSAHALDHLVATVGYRIAEKPGRRFLPEKLEAAGIRGPRVGQLERAGKMEIDGTMVALEEVTEVRAGSVFSFVMDTRECDGAIALAKDSDLLLMEATYLDADQEIAREYGHSTASDAARTAKSAGARRLALAHFSQRYPDTMEHVREAAAIFPEVMALNDLDRVPIPRRR